MKKNAIIILLFCTLGMISCDKIQGPYLSSDDSVNTDVEFPDLDTAAVFRALLLEEYTGHRCNNCPNGHREVENLLQTFGDTLIPISIHAGFLANPNSSFPMDFRTEEGTQLYNDFQLGGTPRGIANRVATVLEVNQWRDSLQNADRHCIAAIQLINQFDASTSKLKVHTKTTLLDSYENPVKLVIYITEDHIIAPQLDGEATIPDYEHMHVLRGSVNGVYGANISENGTVEKGMSYTKSYEVDCSGKNWNPANCSVVAFLTDADTKTVLQVAKLPLINE
ncbi:MAG: Omp28 family outer membrane lipoprotein [Bacteroidales bacterium]|nr:Omp28 family outer membrane lipoprotein [Bacteroidales bacterium]